MNECMFVGIVSVALYIFFISGSEGVGLGQGAAIQTPSGKDVCMNGV
jgi:hypothetical protein